MSSATSFSSRIQPPSTAAEAGLRELMAVREIAHAFLTADRPAEVYQFALDRVSPIVGATLACIYLKDGASDLMPLAAAYNWPERYAPFLSQMKVKLGAGPSGQAAEDRTPVEIPDVFSDRALDDWQEVARELSFRSIVALPLQTSKGVLGAVSFYFTNAGGVSPEARQLLQTVSNQIAATVEKSRLIDDLRRTNAALSESNTELERQYVSLIEARRVKDEFLANISHELRTPLTAVMGYVALMQEGLGGPVSDEQQETLGQVKVASDQLLALINDLLDLTSLKRGGVEPVLSEFDPREALRAGVESAGTRPGPVKLEVTEPPLVEIMKSDRTKVAKVVSILVGNAYKFTPQGAVRVTVKTGGGRVVYTIEDTGIGISVDAHQFIFEEFRQVDGTATRRYGGSGLGLALARRLARLLGGDVSVSSAPGLGSTFRPELPLNYDGPRREIATPPGGGPPS